jgi:hypothetical protein
MRFNVKFTVSNGKETENKFEVIESDTKYDKVNARSILSKKYPDYEITVIKISQSVTATSEII